MINSPKVFLRPHLSVYLALRIHREYKNINSQESFVKKKKAKLDDKTSSQQLRGSCCQLQNATGIEKKRNQGKQQSRKKENSQRVENETMSLTVHQVHLVRVQLLYFDFLEWKIFLSFENFHPTLLPFFILNVELIQIPLL